MFKSKATKKAEQLRALGYVVLVFWSSDSKDVRVIAEKDDTRHVAVYRGRKLTELTSSIKNVWFDVVSYSEISCVEFVRDFK